MDFFRILVSTIPLCGGTAAWASSAETSGPPVDEFRARFAGFHGGGNDLMSKIIDNRGNGYEPLYGLRNLRVVLHGVMYRGGANNKFHRTNPRDNSNPLPPDGLANLCREGFGSAIYLYETNFAPYAEECTTRAGRPNHFEYEQISVLASGAGTVEVLGRVHSCIAGTGPCPVYTHCWNGWHASGLISALALRQFCGFTGEEAVAYWIDGTDSLANSDYPRIKDAIRAFRPVPELDIPASARARICPESPYQEPRSLLGPAR